MTMFAPLNSLGVMCSQQTPISDVTASPFFSFNQQEPVNFQAGGLNTRAQKKLQQFAGISVRSQRSSSQRKGPARFYPCQPLLLSRIVMNATDQLPPTELFFQLRSFFGFLLCGTLDPRFRFCALYNFERIVLVIIDSVIFRRALTVALL